MLHGTGDQLNSREKSCAMQKDAKKDGFNAHLPLLNVKVTIIKDIYFDVSGISTQTPENML